ncbi:MAG TPA: hypothetical protein VGD17_08315 [Chitinophagaceae bacterium]
MRMLVLAFFLFQGTKLFAQVTDTIPAPPPPPVVDSTLRILNLNPYITLHVDSTLILNLEINRSPGKYFWYLRNSPVGLRINKDNGTLSFKAEKSFFLSGKLKYDQPYNVILGVQNLANPSDRIDTSLTLVFYNTEIIPSRVKPSVSSTLYVDEGDVVNFKVQCETGSFPIEHITFFANTPLKNFTLVKACDDEFTWSAPYEFVKETDSGKVKIINLSFVGTTRFMVRDTANVRVIVRDALNYPLAVQEYQMQVRYVNSYILQLKYTFLQLDKKVKKVKNTRTTFDITSSATALTGSIMVSSTDPSTQKTGKVLPSVGVSLVPIKEAVAPQKIYDQNQASLVRTSIKRLEYMLRDNSLLVERDPDIVKKTARLRDELKQIQIQLIDIPVELTSNMTEEELNEYFNSPKVNKKYRTSRR